MCDAHLMQVANTKNQLDGVELHHLFGEASLLCEDLVELGSFDKRHHKVDA